MGKDASLNRWSTGAELRAEGDTEEKAEPTAKNVHYSEDQDPPRLQQRGVIRFIHPKYGLTKSGLLCSVANRRRGGDVPLAYYRKVKQEHYLRVLGGYAMSLSALKDAKKKGVEFIIIAEEETGCVYEFFLADYLLDGEEVGEKFRQHSADKQTIRDRREARRVWDDLDGKLFRPEGADV